MFLCKIKNLKVMQFKEGLSWKACYDEERNLYTAEPSRAISMLLDRKRNLYLRANSSA